MSPISVPRTLLGGIEMPSRPSKNGTLFTTVPTKNAKPSVPIAMNGPARRRKISPITMPTKPAITPAGDHGDDQVHPHVLGEQRRGVGADREEAAVADRHQAGVAGEDAHALCGHDVDDHERRLARHPALEAGRERREQQQREEREHQDQVVGRELALERRHCGHAPLPRARRGHHLTSHQISLRFWIPNRPCGRSASSATIITNAVAVL